MKRTAIVIGFMTVLHGILLIVAQIIGGRTDLPYAQIQYGAEQQVCAVTCIMGIYPGVAVLDSELRQATRILTTHPLFKSGAWVEQLSRESQILSMDTMRLTSTWRDNANVEIRLTSETTHSRTQLELVVSCEDILMPGALCDAVFDLTAGEAVALFGSPSVTTTVYFAAPTLGSITELYYPQSGLSVQVMNTVPDRIGLNDHVIALWVFSPSEVVRSDDMAAWRGFR